MQFKITITNWKKHQPKSDLVRHPHWFKLNNNLPGSMSLMRLNAEQKWVWVGLLCLASKKGGGTFSFCSEALSAWINVPHNVIELTVECLATDGALTIDRQFTDGQLTIDQNRSEQNRKEEGNNALQQQQQPQPLSFPAKKGVEEENWEGVPNWLREFVTQHGIPLKAVATWANEWGYDLVIDSLHILSAEFDSLTTTFGNKPPIIRVRQFLEKKVKQEKALQKPQIVWPKGASIYAD